MWARALVCRPISSVPVPKPARANFRFVIRDPVPHLKCDDAPHATGEVELERAAQVVRRLLIVLEHEMATDRTHFAGKPQPHAPAGDVHLMHTLIAKVAVAVVPVPMPVVVEPVLRELAEWGWTRPAVVVNASVEQVEPSLSLSCRAICSRAREPCRRHQWRPH